MRRAVAPSSLDAHHAAVGLYLQRLLQFPAPGPHAPLAELEAVGGRAAHGPFARELDLRAAVDPDAASKRQLERFSLRKPSSIFPQLGENQQARAKLVPGPLRLAHWPLGDHGTVRRTPSRQRLLRGVSAPANAQKKPPDHEAAGMRAPTTLQVPSQRRRPSVDDIGEVRHHLIAGPCS